MFKIQHSTFDIASCYFATKHNFPPTFWNDKDCVEFEPKNFSYKDFTLHSDMRMMHSEIRVFWDDKQLLISPRKSPRNPSACSQEYLWILWLGLHLDIFLAWTLDIFKAETCMKLRVRPFIPSLQKQLPEIFPLAHMVWTDSVNDVMQLQNLPF